jgi:hypothetical protein
MGVGDWMHSNSIDYNPTLDQIILSVRSFDEVWVIDHSTTTKEAASHTGGRSGRGGDLLYRWGNPMAYRAGTISERRLFKQHDAHWIPAGLPGAGNILVFSNGVDRPTGAYSSVEELVLPTPDSSGNYLMTGATWGPSAATWTYTAPNPPDFFSQFVSGAQRLQNGNTLVCGGWIGLTREVTPQGTPVWEYVNPTSALGTAIQGSATSAGASGVFRAPHYAPDYPAFNNRTLTPREPLERHDPVLLADGSTAPRLAKIGTSVALSIRASQFGGEIYVVGTSASPGLIPVDNRFVRMGWDSLLQASLFALAPATFQQYLGILDGSGRATATMAIPAIPALAGLKLYTTSFVVHPLAPTTVALISNTVTVEIDS